VTRCQLPIMALALFVWVLRPVGFESPKKEEGPNTFYGGIGN